MNSVYIDLFPMFVLELILYDLYQMGGLSKKNRFFRHIVWMTLLVLLADSVCWLVDGRTFPGVREILLVVNLFYFAGSLLIVWMWFMLTFLIMHGERIFAKHRTAFFLLSLPILCFLIILLFKTEWIFFIDQDNSYSRGTYFFVQTILGLAYILVGCVRAWIRYLKEEIPSWKREDFHLAVFAIFPIIGGIVQIMDKRIVLLWPLAVVAMLLFYINIHHERIQIDELTGLYNRRWLDEYLLRRFRKKNKEQYWCLFLVDLNRFKQINDLYGHLEGDEVLRRVSLLLKSVFPKKDSFLARYGGDEFAIVMRCEDYMAKEQIARLIQALEWENRNSKKPYEISLSIGYAMYDREKYPDVESLINGADQKMYRWKKHQQKSDLDAE